MRRGDNSDIRVVLRYQHATLARDRELADRMSQTRPQLAGASLVSLTVAAGEFGVSVKTVRRRISDGTVHGYHVGRLVRVDLDELRQRMIVEIPTRRRPEQ